MGTGGKNKESNRREGEQDRTTVDKHTGAKEIVQVNVRGAGGNGSK
jgi:hypothetical protein